MMTIAPEVGLLLPCNIVVRQIEEGVSEVSLVDPLGMALSRLVSEVGMPAS